MDNDRILTAALRLHAKQLGRDPERFAADTLQYHKERELLEERGAPMEEKRVLWARFPLGSVFEGDLDRLCCELQGRRYKP